MECLISSKGSFIMFLGLASVAAPYTEVKTSAMKQKAKLAGLLYLLVILFGMFAELYVRATLVVADDVAQTVQNIRTNSGLFRLGFVSDLLMQTAFFFLPIALYPIFESINRIQARVMVWSVQVGVAIMCLNMLNQFAVLLMLENESFAAAFDAAQLNNLIFLFMDLQKHGYRIAQIFFGIWLFPLGYLVYKSNYAPKLIGILLMVACFSFSIDFLLFFLLENYSSILSSVITLPTTIAEFSICLWLLIKGIRTQ